MRGSRRRFLFFWEWTWVFNTIVSSSSANSTVVSCELPSLLIVLSTAKECSRRNARALSDNTVAIIGKTSFLIAIVVKWLILRTSSHLLSVESMTTHRDDDRSSSHFLVDKFVKLCYITWASKNSLSRTIV